MGLNTFYKRLKRRYQFMLVIFAGLIILVAYLIFYHHLSQINSSKQEVLDRLKAISNTATLQIDGDMHQHLSDTFKRKDAICSNTDYPIYTHIHQQLMAISSVNNVETPIYTMVYDSSRRYFEFICTSADKPYFRHMYIDYPKKLLDKYQEGGILDVYSDEKGKWLSAFAPIRNDKGQVIAVLQVDQSFGEFIKKANMELLKNIILALVVLIPFSVFFFTYINGTLKKQEDDKQRLEEKNEEIRLQNEIILSSHKKLEKSKQYIEEQNKYLDREVRLRTRELLKANIDLTTFLYRSSHDVQGPIATIKGLCNMASMESGKELLYLGMIGDSAELLTKRVKSISAVYEIKNKRMKKEVFSLLEVVDRIKSEFSETLENIDFMINIEIPDTLQLETDKQLMEIILKESVKNSIEFRNISVKPQINISASIVDENACEIIIEDNGIGIEPGVRKEIFKMFKRANERSNGSGLGLYSIKLALHRMQGSINLLSTKQKGTKFRLVIPQKLK